jgi:hypothetical protein
VQAQQAIEKSQESLTLSGIDFFHNKEKSLASYRERPITVVGNY